MAGIVGSENPTRVLTAHSIMGDKVVNTAGEDLGDIKDLMIDLNKGCIAYAVLDYSTGFLNLQSKYFAVPWQAFTVDEDRKQLVLNVDKDRLENAPGFDQDHWPMSNDQQYYNSVDQYYQGSYESRMGGTMGGTGYGTGGSYGGGTMGGGTTGGGY